MSVISQILCSVFACLGIELFQKKSIQGELRIYFSENFTWNFLICRFILRNSSGIKSTPGNYTNLCDTPWKFQGQKPRLMEIPDDSFLNTSENSTCFFSNWFLEFSFTRSISLEGFPCLHPTCFSLDFFWNNPLSHIYEVTICSICTDVDILTLKYLARYIGLNSINKIAHSSVNDLFQKNPNGGQVEDIYFWKPPRNFSFFYFTPGNSTSHLINQWKSLRI